MANPSPVPVCLVVKNGSKMRGQYLFRQPRPAVGHLQFDALRRSGRR